MSIVTAEQTITAPPPLAYDTPPADILERAADILIDSGRFPGAYWEDSGQARWWPGMPCSADAAIGIAMGRVRRGQVEAWVVPTVVDPDEPPHAALAALMAHLGLDSVNGFFAWSDAHEAGVIAGEMRRCAARLRDAVTCVTCQAEYPSHYEWCPQIRPVRDELRAEVAA